VVLMMGGVRVWAWACAATVLATVLTLTFQLTLVGCVATGVTHHGMIEADVSADDDGDMFSFKMKQEW
jgi:hypothetical protein